MYDTFHKIEDFKKKIENRPNILDDLRMTIQEEAFGEMAVKVSIILTIPYKDDILRHYVGRVFNRYFYNDKDCDENKQYRDFVKKAYDKVKEHFGDVTEGYWSDE